MRALLQVCQMALLLALTASASPNDDAKQPVSKVLYGIIAQDGVEAAVQKYHQLKKEKNAPYDFAEADLNGLGYQLVNENKLQAALAIFKLNTEAYPNSPNAFDSLGEAYLRLGERAPATAHYEKSLALLKTAGLADNVRTSLQKNAEAKLAYLRDPATYRQSTELTDFVANNEEYPYGRLHPKAPPETEHWGRLAGEWDCSVSVPINGRWVQGGQSKWVWKYILDGFAVQDLWYTKWINVQPNLAHIHRDAMGTNIRMYKPDEGKWEAVWFANGSNTTSHFEAVSDGETVVMTDVTRSPWVRITFYDMTDESFDWKSETSKDEGETWQETFRIHGKRVR